MTAAVPVPIIGIGASPKCDGQVLVTEDMLGLFERTPRFVKRYADMASEIGEAVGQYAEEVRSPRLPDRGADLPAEELSHDRDQPVDHCHARGADVPAASDDELARVARFGEPVTFAAGQMVARVGEVGRGLLLILSGKVKVASMTHRETRDIVTHERGNFMGELAPAVGPARTWSTRSRWRMSRQSPFRPTGCGRC